MSVATNSNWVSNTFRPWSRMFEPFIPTHGRGRSYLPNLKFVPLLHVYEGICGAASDGDAFGIGLGGGALAGDSLDLASSKLLNISASL